MVGSQYAGFGCLSGAMVTRGDVGPLVHGADQVVDELLAVAVLAALDEVQALLGQAAVGRVELEGPQEVGGLLEGGADGVDLVDQVLNADDVVLAQRLHTHTRQFMSTPVLAC